MKESFAQAKAGFDRQRETLEDAEKKAMNALEHAFDFMEQAFENGEEMVVFVTELTLSPEAAMFLAEHTCERYMTYNEQLLIRKTEKRTLIRTESLGNTHDAGNSARMEIKMKQSETRILQ